MPRPPPGTVRREPERRRSTGSLRRTFMGAALATTVPFLLLLGYLTWRHVSDERARVQREVLARATELSGRVGQHLGARLDALGGAAAVLGATGLTPASAERQAGRLKEAFADVDRVMVVDELGVAVAVAPPAPGGRRIAVGDQEWFRRAATSTAPVVGDPTQAGTEVVVGVFGPVRTPEGALRGAVRAELSLRGVQELLQQEGLAAGTVAALITEPGVVVARQPPLAPMQSVRELPLYAALVPRGGTAEVGFDDGETRLTGAVGVRGVGWVVAVGVPSRDVLRAQRADVMLALGGGLVVALLALLAAARLSARQVEAFDRLREAMGRLEAGDLPASVPLTVGGEAGALIGHFNGTLNWLRGKLREYEVISQVEEAADQVAAGDRSVDRVLPGLLRRVVSGVRADVGVLLLHEEGELALRAAVGFPGAALAGSRVRRGQGLTGSAASERATVIVPDVQADYRVEEPYLKDGGVRSMAAVPMLAGEELLGVVAVGYRSAHAFPSDEVLRLEAIARRTAQAVARARALDSVHRSSEGLEAQLAAQLEALQKAAVEQTEARRQAQEARKKAQELEQRMKLQASQPPQIKEVIVEREVVRESADAEQSARLRAEMQRTVSEELRAPLVALLELPRLLVEGLQKPLGDDERGQLEVLQERGQEILELIEGLTVLSGLRAGRTKMARTAVDLAGLVQRVVRTLQPRAAAKGNRIEVDIKPPLVPVLTDTRQLEHVLANLILSAVKYTEVGEIRVTCYQRDGQVVLTVSDDGVGFTPEEQARIFEPFLAVEPRGGRSLPGTGLLLTVAERLVSALGGRIRVESEPDRGTWVTVSLPGQG